MSEKRPHHEEEPRQKHIDTHQEYESLAVETLEKLINNSRLINSGNNGIIFRFEVNDVEELREAAPADESEKFKVVKLLKVYQSGKGEHEYQMQKTAFDIVDKATNRDELALVPEPLLFRNLSLKAETVDYLNRRGAKLNDKADILVMDYVDGKDLATDMYEWIIAHANPYKITAVSGSNDDLKAAVSQILGFDRPGGKGVTEQEREAERRKVESLNGDKVYTALRRSNFKVKKTIIDQITKTMQLFHRNGIHHNDPHERNFMTMGDQVYIVDFAEAGEPNEQRVNDDYIINRLNELMADKSAHGDTVKMVEGVIKRKEWPLWYAEFRKKPDAVKLELAKVLRMGENQMNFFAVGVYKLREEGLLTNEELSDLIELTKGRIEGKGKRQKRVQTTSELQMSNKLLRL